MIFVFPWLFLSASNLFIASLIYFNPENPREIAGFEYRSILGGFLEALFFLMKTFFEEAKSKKIFPTITEILDKTTGNSLEEKNLFFLLKNAQNALLLGVIF